MSAGHVRQALQLAARGGQVERLLDELRAQPEPLPEQAEAAAAFIADTYSEERERESALACRPAFLPS